MDRNDRDGFFVVFRVSHFCVLSFPPIGSSTYSYATNHSSANGKHNNLTATANANANATPNGYHQNASSFFSQPPVPPTTAATAAYSPHSAGPGDHAYHNHRQNVSSAFTPPSQDQPFPSISHSLDSRSSVATESRRSSTDSRVNQGLGSLSLNGMGGFHSGGSNFASENASQVSFASSGRRRERGVSVVSNGDYSLRPSRSNNTMFSATTTNDAATASSAHSSSMNAHRASCGTCMSETDYRDCEASSSATTVGSGGKLGPRIAPTIAENPEAEIYNAEIPTRGKAYAFPDPIVGPVTPSSGTGSTGRRPDTSTRRSSINLFTGEESDYSASIPGGFFSSF